MSVLFKTNSIQLATGKKKKNYAFCPVHYFEINVIIQSVSYIIRGGD